MSVLDGTIEEFCSHCAYPGKSKNLEAIVALLCNIIEQKMDMSVGWETAPERVSIGTIVCRARASIV